MASKLTSLIQVNFVNLTHLDSLSQVDIYESRQVDIYESHPQLSCTTFLFVTYYTQLAVYLCIEDKGEKLFIFSCNSFILANFSFFRSEVSTRLPYCHCRTSISLLIMATSFITSLNEGIFTAKLKRESKARF